jgi:hypothetical protein
LSSAKKSAIAHLQQLLRCQYMFLCTSKASNQSTPN